MAIDSTELHTLSDDILGPAGRAENDPRSADQFTVPGDDPLAEVAGLIEALADLDPAEAAEPASRISEMLGAALDEEDR